MTYFNRIAELVPAKWVQVDCRPTYACFRNQAFFYDDVKIDFKDWTASAYIYSYIVIHDDDAGWATVQLELTVT